jgi:hypothetical protein
MKRDLAIRALKTAIALRAPPQGCIHHNDVKCTVPVVRVFGTKGGLIQERVRLI